MAVITKLFEDTGEQKFDFINVARIEQSISPKDLWAIEAGISLGQDPKVRYGALNELLKLDEGRKAGFSNKEIAELLYGVDDEDEIAKKLARLDLIKKYLKQYYDDEEDMTPVEGYNEHFIDLQNILISAKGTKTISERAACQKVGFRLIHDGVAHLRLRTINQAIRNDYSIEKIVNAADEMGPQTTPEPLDPDLDEEPSTPTVTRFTDFEDEVKARKNEDKVPLILNSILNNLAVLKFDSDDLKTEEATEKIRKILTFMKKLTNITGE